VEGVTSWFDYMSSRTDLIVSGLTQTLVYVVAVTLAAGITAVVVAVLTLRHTFAKELALAISSVFLTIPSLALFTIFIPIVGLGFTPSFIALYLYAIMPILRNTSTGLDSVDPSVLESAKGMGLTRWIWTGVILSLALAFAIDSLLRGVGRFTTPRTKKA
jgi:osmoprotectant transport system permease protein